MRIGFVGAPSDLPGMHAPGIAQPAGGALFDNTFYSYRVRQSNAVGASDWSSLRSLKRQ